MHLINVHTYELEEFIGSQIPKYAILSHCWGSEEVILREWQTSREAVQHKAGYMKIKSACEKAKDHDCAYLWCDTNCIDKSSSAGLSEAINSMFQWYRDAHICFAYLDDVSIEGEAVRGEYGLQLTDSHVPSFRRSRWFTRGCTLQELIAPTKLMSFSREWREIGTKKLMCDIVSEITKIPRDQLKGFKPRENSVAARMSWAASRETTRLEDNAYCLLGIFDINMPLLYGEGHKAFIRLQQEILQSSYDLSLLAWDFESQTLESNHYEEYSKSRIQSLPLLAESPRWFVNCQTIRTNELEYDEYLADSLRQTKPGLFLDLYSCPCLIREVTGRNS